jgi:hypothetical protein
MGMTPETIGRVRNVLKRLARRRPTNEDGSAHLQPSALLLAMPIKDQAVWEPISRRRMALPILAQAFASNRPSPERVDARALVGLGCVRSWGHDGRPLVT